MLFGTSVQNITSLYLLVCVCQFTELLELIVHPLLGFEVFLSNVLFNAMLAHYLACMMFTAF
jgi:hypothetical protein